MTSTTQSNPFSQGTEITVNDYGNHRPAKVIEHHTTRPSRGGFAYLVEFTDTDLIERGSFDAAMVAEREPVPDQREQMRAQIQSIAYDGTVQIDRMNESKGVSYGDRRAYMRMLEAKVERIANIAEAGEPDEDWETITGEVDDPRRDEDNQAALDESRRSCRLAERVDWLCREGWDVNAGDYRRGDISLTELLRRLHDEPAVVEQIATWLEEDAAEATV